MNWMDCDQDALDAEYDNRRTVADYNGVMREWREASENARRTCQLLPDLAYGPDPRARIDVYPAGGKGEAVIFFHGGFWRSFDKAGLAFLAPAFVEAGISLAMPNYPLAPEADMATIVRHAREAVGWIVQHAGELGFKSERIWIAGHSAGAHLAVSCAVPWAGKTTIPRCVGCLAVSGIYDLAPIRRSYLNATLRLSESDVATFSPIAIDSAGPYLMTAVGDRETTEFRRQTAAMVERWRSTGGVCDHVPLSNTDHYEAVGRLARPEDEFFRRLRDTIRAKSSS